MSTIGPFLKKNAPWIVAALLLVIIMVGSGFGYKYHQNQLRPLDSLNTELIKRDELQALRIQQIFDSVSTLDYQYEDFKDEYVREYNRRIRLEREIRSIISMRFNRAYLDSIADHYKFR